MPQSIATAIAEGNLNPCTMEAFSYFPSSSQTNSTNMVRCDRLKKQEKRSLSSEDGCFAAVTSCKSRKDEKRVSEHKQVPFVVGRKHIDGAVELEKLKLPLMNDCKEESIIIIQKEVPKIPENNPFKKRNMEDILLKQSVLTETESSEMLYPTPDSQQSVDSKPVKTTEEDTSVHREKKTKRSSNCHSSVQKSSILNFFSRV